MAIHRPPFPYALQTTATSSGDAEPIRMRTHVVSKKQGGRQAIDRIEENPFLRSK
jgi:hypothetical protein